MGLRPLNHRECGNWDARKIDGKDTTDAGQVPGVDPPSAGLDAPATIRKPKTEAGAINATLLVRTEQVFDVSAGETATAVLNLQQDSLGIRADA